MKECYDTQSGQMAEFDNTTAQATGALQAQAARAMCADKVAACAALWASSPNAPTCKINAQGKIENSDQCGLGALLAFVGTVDSVKIAEGCEKGVRAYVEDLCKPLSGETGRKFPWGCRLRDRVAIKKMLTDFTDKNCAVLDDKDTRLDTSGIATMIERVNERLMYDVSAMLYAECEQADGIWLEEGDDWDTSFKLETAFYNAVFGNKTPTLPVAAGEIKTDEWGFCIQNNVRYQCLAQNDGMTEGAAPWATYDASRSICTFTESWYKDRCENHLFGYWEGGTCYVAP
jgi:hypothetical protein